eukprot:scaffold278157_cov13-Prasinocladus_malaysianus.AAC.1
MRRASKHLHHRCCLMFVEVKAMPQQRLLRLVGLLDFPSNLQSTAGWRGLFDIRNCKLSETA